MAVYRHDFEVLSSFIEDIPPKGLEVASLKGLRPEICAELKLLVPNSLVSMMDMAQAIDVWDKNLACASGLNSTNCPPHPRPYTIMSPLVMRTETRPLSRTASDSVSQDTYLLTSTWSPLAS